MAMQKIWKPRRQTGICLPGPRNRSRTQERGGLWRQEPTALDTEHFRLGWHDQTHATDGDLLRLQGLLANQLPHPGLNPIEATQYQHRSLYTRGPPPRHGLELGHYLVEPETEVRLDVIGVIRDPVLREDGDGSATHKRRAGQDLLQVCCC